METVLQTREDLNKRPTVGEYAQQAIDGAK
jgi:hypothetical protein